MKNAMPPQTVPTNKIDRYFLVFLRITAPPMLPKSPKEMQNTPISEQSRES